MVEDHQICSLFRPEHIKLFRVINIKMLQKLSIEPLTVYDLKVGLLSACKYVCVFQLISTLCFAVVNVLIQKLKFFWKPCYTNWKTLYYNEGIFLFVIVLLKLYPRNILISYLFLESTCIDNYSVLASPYYC